jgi:hypothetical protein
MQLVDSKLYSANVSTSPDGWQHFAGGAHHRTDGDLISWLKRTSASERLLTLLLVAFVLTASPALITTIRSTVSVALQILSQAGHAGFIAFQIFGR